MTSDDLETRIAAKSAEINATGLCEWNHRTPEDLIKSRPIQFMGDMVRAILEDRKTQTRRTKGLDQVNTFADEVHFLNNGSVRESTNGRAFADYVRHGSIFCIKCPYGKPGDRLWVKERFQCYSYEEEDYITPPRDVGCRRNDYHISYAADLVDGPFRSSMFMPRWCSRIDLEITAIRVERVKTISGPDCCAEGILFKGINDGPPLERGIGLWRETKSAYAKLWDEINGPGAWKENPWVWVITFARLRPESRNKARTATKAESGVNDAPGPISASETKPGA